MFLVDANGKDIALVGRVEDAEAIMTLHNNGAMPQTTKERQESLRARRAIEGMTEVRGIYLPPELHAEVKQIAKKMLKGWANKVKSDIVPVQ